MSLRVCVSVKGHATLFRGWIMTLNLRPCLLNSVRGPVWCVGSLQDKVGKLGGSRFSFEIFFFSKMQNQFLVHYFLTLGELNISDLILKSLKHFFVLIGWFNVDMTFHVTWKVLKPTRFSRPGQRTTENLWKQSCVFWRLGWLGEMYLLAQHGGESAAILAPTVQSLLCTALQQLPAYV